MFRTVLTDIQMPEMDGFKVAELIQATEKYWFDSLRNQSIESFTKAKRECPIIAITAHCDESVIARARKCGIRQVLPKPVDENMINLVLKEFYYS